MDQHRLFMQIPESRADHEVADKLLRKTPMGVPGWLSSVTLKEPGLVGSRML